MLAQILRLGRGSLIYGIGGVLNKFINLLLLPLFTRYLTPADYGVSSMLAWISFFVVPVCSLGIGASLGICYFENQDRSRRDATVWTGFIILAISTLILALCGHMLARPLSILAFQTPQYRYLMLLAILTACTTVLSTPFPLWLQFEERAVAFVSVTTFLTVISIGLSILMVVVLGRGIQGLIEAGLIAGVVTLLVYLVLALREIRFAYARDIARELLRQGLPLIPSFAFIFVILHGNRYVLQWYHGLGALGVYTVGFNLGMIMYLFVTAFSNAWLPFFMSFRDKQEEAALLFGHITTYYILGFGSLCLAIFCAAKPVVMIMTQSSFHDAYQVVGLTALASGFIGLFNTFLPAVYFHKKIKYVTVVQALGAGVSLICAFTMIPHGGIFGAALSLAAGTCIMAIMMHLCNKKHRDWFQVSYEWRRIFIFALFILAYAVIMLWPRNWSLGAEMMLSVITLISIPLIIVTQLTSEEKRQIISILGLCHNG